MLQRRECPQPYVVMHGSQGLTLTAESGLEKWLQTNVGSDRELMFSTVLLNSNYPDSIPASQLIVEHVF